MVQQIALPITVISKTDVVKLRRELEALDESLRQAAVRQKAADTTQAPSTSRQLNETLQANNLDAQQADDRRVLLEGLQQLVSSAPTVHISFASNPSAGFMERLTSWFRQQVDPSLLIEVGLQPSIAAGCVVRTKSKYFDFSLRKRLASHQPELLEKMRSLETG